VLSVCDVAVRCVRPFVVLRFLSTAFKELEMSCSATSRRYCAGRSDGWRYGRLIKSS
jgi:hypothetical protein